MKLRPQAASETLWNTTLWTDVILTRNLCMNLEDYRYIQTAILNFRNTDSEFGIRDPKTHCK